MGKQETDIEKHFCDEIKRLGGFTRKYRSPSQRGVPDRIAFLTHPFFVELKTPYGELSQLQIREINRMREQGAVVVVLSSKNGVDNFIRGLEQLLARRPDAECNVM